jgi:hypothetical protein
MVSLCFLKGYKASLRLSFFSIIPKLGFNATPTFLGICCRGTLLLSTQICSSYLWQITPKFNSLKQQIFIYLIVSVSQEFGSGLAVWFCFRVSFKVVIKMSAGLENLLPKQLAHMAFGSWHHFLAMWPSPWRCIGVAVGFPEQFKWEGEK